MKRHQEVPIQPSLIFRSFMLLALTLVLSTSVSATDLSGKVTEVVDGNTISLMSLTHTIKVRLLAVAPPEKNQPYAEVARKHLSDLILGKYVVVRYTGIGEQGYLVGRILLEQGDVNAQMLRDGVAWYYHPEARDLAESDRELYDACEKAARSERRGLWQEQSPTAPWDFKNARLVTPDVSAPVLPKQESDPFRRAGKRSELTSDDLMSGVVGGGAKNGQPNARPLSPNAAPGSWMNYQPADQHFSILVPSDGFEFARPIVGEDGSTTNFHSVIGRRGQVLCQLTWAEGPNNQHTDAAAVTTMMQRIIKATNVELAKHDTGVAITSKELGSLRMGDYTGKEYSLNVGESLGLVRILSRQVGNNRELVVLMVMNKNDDEKSANQFLSSFKVNTKSQTGQ